MFVRAAWNTVAYVRFSFLWGGGIRCHRWGWGVRYRVSVWSRSILRLYFPFKILLWDLVLFLMQLLLPLSSNFLKVISCCFVRSKPPRSSSACKTAWRASLNISPGGGGDSSADGANSSGGVSASGGAAAGFIRHKYIPWSPLFYSLLSYFPCSSGCQLDEGDRVEIVDLRGYEQIFLLKTSSWCRRCELRTYTTEINRTIEPQNIGYVLNL